MTGPANPTRQRILDAALVEFADHGFEGGSTRRIAERAGLRHPAISYHFGSKEQLWQEAVAQVFEQFLARVAAAEPDPDLPVRGVIREFVRFSFEQPALHRLMLRESSQPSARLEWLADHYLRRLLGEGAEAIGSAQRAGQMVSGDPRLLFYAIVGMASAPAALGSEVELLTGRRLSHPATFEEYWTLIAAMLFPRG